MAGHDRAFAALDRLFSDGQEIAPDAPARAVGKHEMIMYEGVAKRHPIDQMTNSEPGVLAATDEVGTRRAWEAMPLIPKLLAIRAEARDVSSPGFDARLLQAGADAERAHAGPSGSVAMSHLFV